MEVSRHITRLLEEAQSGNLVAASKLNKAIYSILREAAPIHIRCERPGHTLQPTALAHEIWIKLRKTNNALIDGAQSTLQVRVVIGIMMYHHLVDYARRRGKRLKGEHEQGEAQTRAISEGFTTEDLLALDGALIKLADVNSRQGLVVLLKMFCGLTWDEVAAEVGRSKRSVQLDLACAKRWLGWNMRNLP